MKILETTYDRTKTLHHAYCIVGDCDASLSELNLFLHNTLGLSLEGNPDVFIRTYDVLTIDDTRQLSALQEAKGFGGGGLKIFIIKTNSITEQSQNAFLKIFEEPTVGTHFFLVMPQDTLLPTFRSRLQMIWHTDEKNKSRPILDITQLTMAERLNMVKDITSGIKDEKMVKQDAIDFLNHIELSLYNTGVQKNSESLEVCQRARSSLTDNGAPVKMILESLVVSI